MGFHSETIDALGPRMSPAVESKALRLPLPRWPYFWPLLVIPAYGLNGVLNLGRAWHGSFWERVLGVLMLVVWLTLGCTMAVGILASRWRELRLENGQLLLKPGLNGFPRWVRWTLNPAAAQAYRDGELAIPLAQASLEWVGRKLLLHGHPEVDVPLGRGQRAELIAQWLCDRGLSAPVGR